MNRTISLKQVIALGALTTSFGAISSFPTFAAAIDSRKTDYTIEKHQKLGGEICGTHEHKGHRWQASPALDAKMTALKKSKTAQGVAAASGGKYTIPVVVHVFGSAHNCEENNGICVTDEVVIDALKTSNEDFQGLTTLDGPIAPEFAAIRENLDIEFVLAKVDPDGNPTTGIVRHGEDVGHGNGGDNEAVMNAAWDNYKYMNIYIVNDLYGDGALNNSGVAWYPNSEMSDKNLARVVYNGNYLGKNANENFRSVFTHEFGHWLNLAHTFNGNDCNAPGEAFCAMEGDKVCDTPQINSSRLQNNAPNCLGQATNTENFMHYSNNYAMFTAQQVDRMTAALYHPSRVTLWTDENLTATGLAEHITEGPTWDGISGAETRPEGEVIFEKTDLSAAKDDVSTFEFSVPAGTQAISVYLDGYEKDPDIYLSHGEMPIDENGNYQQEYVSFNASGTNEAINILAPKTEGKYYVAVHAYSEYANARLSVVAMEDASSCAQCEQVLIGELKDLSGNIGDEAITASFEVPDGAKLVSFDMPAGYWGDPDIHVSHNSVPQVDVADCLPWKAPGVRERCEFRGENLGGTYNLLIHPYGNYGNANLTVHYTQINPESDAENTAPIARSSGNQLTIAGEAVEFSSMGSSDIDGTISAYHWDFGDGNSSEEANPSHTYEHSGSYTVTLTVTDEDGASSSRQSQVAVSRILEHCLATANNQYDHIQNVKLGVLDHTSDAAVANGYENLTAYTALIPTGDNTLTLMGAGALSGTPTHHWNVWMDLNNDNEFSEDESVTSFSAVGVSSQTINIPETAKGVTGTMRIAVKYGEQPQAACGELGEGEFKDFTFRVNSDPIAQANGAYGIVIGSAVTFNSSGSSDAESEITYLWDFGDGNTSTEANPTHTYQSVGQYNVTLTVTDSLGATATDSTIANVVVPAETQISQAKQSSGGSLGIFSAFALMLLGLRRK